MKEGRQGRLQFSLRTLLLVTAAVSVLLVPVAWVARDRHQMVQAQQEILWARETALRSVVREEQRRRGAAAPSKAISQQDLTSPGLISSFAEQDPAIERLRLENADLRQQLEQLRREVEALKYQAKPTDEPGR